MKSAATSRLACPHHIDHLAPLCSVFTAPFVSSNEEELLQLKEFYPDVKGIYVPESEAGPKYLTEHLPTTNFCMRVLTALRILHCMVMLTSCPTVYHFLIILQIRIKDVAMPVPLCSEETCGTDRAVLK